ncbi:hypothetical protein Z517_05990 [Fonsecaea pedrosoi CBS 271.37]|uniref:Zn(2)-C6 fungal-type domain-containing protein n=1 Tax=Fonsecaea pedrosoi CBS 271.37 TaxID=1442368 RepID=A0A0D2GF01_9EURO|nr:uncharacterized protein Z517_05990 [Fonsecaea pedrosoi CBS 271.37]KIW79378.1 hypothetical protein Z517_05990 [Fonsecaea pedrosoi CBS 271.37]
MSGAERQPTNGPQASRFTSSNPEQRQENTMSKRRQPKSRTEAKPSCTQCLDRGVECGGYVRNLKWKLVGEQPKKRSRPEERQLQSLENMSIERISRPFYKDATSGDHVTTPPLQAEASMAQGIASTNSASSARTREEPLWQSLPQDQLFDFGDVDFSVDFFLGEGNIDLNVPSDLGSPTNTSPGPSLEMTDSHLSSSRHGIDLDMRKEKAPDLSDLIISPPYIPRDFEGQSGTAADSSQLSLRRGNIEDNPVLRERPSPFSDTPKTVKQLFDRHLCDALSIKDDPFTNPWRLYIWPLADECPALYHALAAMTYLYLSNARPEFSGAGSKNFHASLEALARDQNKPDTSLEASIAARLALGFAEAWDDQAASPGVEHIKTAGTLLRGAFDKDRITRLTSDELDRLNFLARTWVYKVVMTGLTTSDDGEFLDVESITRYIELDRLPVEQQLDPLLGCAITLFPLIARLTNIIKAVRRRTEKHNSPSIISRGAELWTAIEDWSPSFDPQQSENPPSHVSDIIQTAEAYRWTALLLLRHAVPELPWAHSMLELAEKVLIYLATTPVTSRTMVIQIFPLMAIGGETFDEEDRNWVCQRWDAMAKRMPISRLDKCLKVTKEVWRRKDTFEAQRGACPSCGAYRPRSTGTGSPMDTLTDTDLSVASSKKSEEGSRRCRCNAVKLNNTPSSSFPDSLAFKKGIDNITRAGNLHYTVRGELHWLKVMEDWKWQVVLG